MCKYSVTRHGRYEGEIIQPLVPNIRCEASARNAGRPCRGISPSSRKWRLRVTTLTLGDKRFVRKRQLLALHYPPLDIGHVRCSHWVQPHPLTIARPVFDISTNDHSSKGFSHRERSTWRQENPSYIYSSMVSRETKFPLLV